MLTWGRVCQEGNYIPQRGKRAYILVTVKRHATEIRPSLKMYVLFLINYVNVIVYIYR